MKHLILFLLAAILENGETAVKPHIVMIIADDLGWNDVSFHGSDQVATPNIDRLAAAGVTLDNYYVTPICSPTRSAIMTGRYPIHTGMQESTIFSAQPYGVGLNETFLPQYLKKQGYSTHAVGKWHLGFFQKEYTPTYRGFDTFYGYYCGKADYWDHSDTEVFSGLDLHDGEKSVYTQWRNYSTEMYTAEALGRIRTHNTSQPMFLYLAYQAVHSANTAQDPLQAPQKWVDRFSHIQHKGRRVFAAMTAYMDHSIGRIHKALAEKDMLKDTVIVFTTDNGGPANGFDFNWANNYPLRGVKASLFEGGVRATGFVYSKLLANPRITRDLIHVTDWLPTLVRLAGGVVEGRTDGVDQWPTLQKICPSPRTEILLNIDEVTWKNEALVVGNWKLIKDGINWDGWYRPPGLSEADLKKLTVKCQGKPPVNATHCGKEYCLFDIAQDPCEFHDVSRDQPHVVAIMVDKLRAYKEGMVKPRNNKTADPLANPKLHNGAWEPWQISGGRN